MNGDYIEIHYKLNKNDGFKVMKGDINTVVNNFVSLMLLKYNIKISLKAHRNKSLKSKIKDLIFTEIDVYIKDGKLIID